MILAFFCRQNERFSLNFSNYLVFIVYFEKEFVSLWRLYIVRYGCKQRTQSLKSATGGEKEIQSLVIQRVGLFTYNRIKMVYKFIPASFGDVDENNKIARRRPQRSRQI